MYDIIEKKRDGGELSRDEINFFIKGCTAGTIPDYQTAALLMAIFLKGMNPRETADLTDSMASSGDMVDLSEIEGIKVDKHSTGGVGDKTTLVLGPIVAACGVPVAKMSGRGLGHTGGTIDKLESIPGFRTSLSKDEFINNVREIGLAVAGQTGNLAPADKKLYALRDVTATINNISLIASSIMSKKIAAGGDKIVLDVKSGSGAFMKSFEQAVELARAMVAIGERVGRETVAYVTEMDVPLGYAIGNSLEVEEAIEALKGGGPDDLTEVSAELAAKMLELAGKGSFESCRNMAYGALRNGSAFNKFLQMVERQGGDIRVVKGDKSFPAAACKYNVTADKDGYVCRIITDCIGKASVILGAGRETKESNIDYTAGIMLYKKTGDKVKKGDILAVLHTTEKNKAIQAEQFVLSSYVISDIAPVKKPLILAKVDRKGVEAAG